MTSKVHYSSDSDEWGTPQDFFDKYNKRFYFTVDVCASSSNFKCFKYYTRDDDGLMQSWAGERCWCNPPYGRGEKGPKPWLEKALGERYNGALSVFLLAARTDTVWFHQLILPHADEVEFIKGRLWFVGVNGVVAPAPFPSMVVIYKPKELT